MSEGYGPAKRFAIGDRGAENEPNYERAVRALSDGELEDEILGGKGELGYRAALIAEQEARAARGAPT